MKKIKFLLFYGIKDIQAHRGLSILVLLTLFLGFFALLGVELFKDGVAQAIELRSQDYLSADVGISGRRPFSEKEELHVELAVPKTQWSELKEFYTMVSAKDSSRLMQVRVVDEKFPFYGHFELDSSTEHLKTTESLHQNEPIVWAYPEVLAQLKLKLNDRVKIGAQEFRIAHVVSFDSANTLTGLDLAPRLYIGSKFADQTGLLQKGSTVWYSYLFKKAPDKDLKEFKKILIRAVPSADLRIYTHFEAGESANRMISYLQDYLGLVGLVVLFLSFLGCWYLLDFFFQRKRTEMGILNSLGLENLEIKSLMVAEVLVFFIGASLLAIVSLFALSPYLKDLVFELAQSRIDFAITVGIIAKALLFSVMTCLLLSWPLLGSVGSISGGALFYPESEISIFKKKKLWFRFVPLFLFLIVIALFQAHSYKVGGFFIIGLLLGSILLAALAMLMIKSLNMFSHKQENDSLISRLSISFRLALNLLTRNSRSSILTLTVLGLSTLLISLISHLEKGLLQETTASSASLRPSLFLFDIQEEQVESLKGKLSEIGYSFQQVSPMVRARLKAVNGILIQRAELSDSSTREEQEERNSRNRGYNLTYRAKISESEKVVEGQYSGSTFDGNGIAEFSAEKKFAQRMGWKLRDRITFDVLGVDIEAKLTSIRSVNWTSFQPNYFVQFQPGVLEDVPKTFIASLPAMKFEERQKVQYEVASVFPNISMIDVERLLNRILALAETMATTLKMMSLLTFGAGLLILWALLQIHSQSRKQDAQLLRMLGLEENKIRNVFLFEGLILFTGAAAIGNLLSLILSFGLSWFLFDQVWAINTSGIVLSFVLSVGLGLLLSAIQLKSLFSGESQKTLHEV